MASALRAQTGARHLEQEGPAAPVTAETCSREEPSAKAFWLSFALALVASLLPLWLVRYLPMIDVPQHLSMIQVWNQLGDPDSPFHQFFMHRPGFTPYLTYYWVVSTLGVLLPLEAANRVFVSACVVGLPLATLALLRSLGRSPWLALLACPLAYDFSLRYGFLNFSSGVVLCVAGLAIYVKRLRGSARGWPWELALVMVPVACAMSHAVSGGLFFGALVVLAAPFPQRWFGTAVRAVPAMALLMSWAVPSLFGHRSEELAFGELKLEPLATHWEKFPESTFSWFEGHGGTIMLLAYSTLVVVCAVLASRQRLSDSTGLVAVRAMMVFACAAWLAYLFLPWDTERILLVYPRFASLALLATLVAIPLAVGPIPKTLQRLLLGICLLWGGYLAVQFDRVQQETGDLEELAKKMDRGSCIAPLKKYFPSDVFRGSAGHSHDAEYLALFTQSIPGYTFAFTPHFPLALKQPNGTLAHTLREAALPVFKSNFKQSRRFIGFYHYFLAPSSYSKRSLFGSFANRIEPIGEAGPFVLYLNPRGTCGRPRRASR